MKLPVTRTKIQTRYSDTDAMGHITNGMYVTYMEVGRLDFYHEIERQTGILLPSVVANLQLDYLKECFYGDDLEVVTWCSRVGNKSITIAAEIFANGALSAKGTVVSVAFDRKTRKATQLPEGWEVSDYSA